MTGEAWYHELLRQGYSEERAHLRAFGVLVTETVPVQAVPDEVEPEAVVTETRWWPDEDEVYAALGDPLELRYGPE